MSLGLTRKQFFESVMEYLSKHLVEVDSTFELDGKVYILYRPNCEDCCVVCHNKLHCDVFDVILNPLTKDYVYVVRYK